MKRTFSLLLTAALLVVTCACGGETSTSSQSAAPAQSAAAASSAPAQTEPEKLDLTLAFTGDINLDDDWYVMQYLKNSAGGKLSACIDPVLLEKMNQADLCCINNEFTLSDRGEKLAGKAYTFRAKPQNVSYLKEMGADLVTLANNHIYDYGKDAFNDTLDNLSKAGIDYVGAGRNKAEAAKPLVYDLNGLKVAYVNATRAELTLYTPDAGENSPGVLSCYDPAQFEKVIAQAKQQAMANSYMLSADNAHATHPNFPQKSDPCAPVRLGGGVVLKYNASQKYTTNAVSGAIFRAICRKADVPVQVFTNRADEAGGSTLGNLQSHTLPIPMADIGCAQFAMHSAVETASVADAEAMTKAVAAFYRVHLRALGDGTYTLE